MSAVKKAPAPPKTREVVLEPHQREHFEAQVRRVNALKARLNDAIEAQNLALRMIGVDPERVAGYSDGVLTVTISTGDNDG